MNLQHFSLSENRHKNGMGNSCDDAVNYNFQPCISIMFQFKLEAGSRKLEAGSRKFGAFNRKF
jgi:hypothetical protein